MKKYLLLALLPLALVSCSNKTDNNTDNKDSLAYMQQASHGTIADEARDFDYDVEYKGATYKVHIHRAACDSLQTITDDFGDVFADYRISVQIKREGNSVLDRTFTKKDFASYINESELKNCILEGIAFDRTCEGGLIFGVSISRPDSEGGNRLTMTIDSAGGMTITRAQTQDVSNNEEVMD